MSEAFAASVQFFYVVNAKAGAPAYVTAQAEGTPITTFANGKELQVIDTSPDKRWLTVVIPGPGERRGFVSSALVTSGIRAR